MGWLVLVLVVAALIGGVVWNRRNATMARQRVQFLVPATPEAVAEAVRTAYCAGARAALSSTVSRVKVTQAGPTTFRASSTSGDTAVIEIGDGASGSVVRARATDLYIGSHPSSHRMAGAGLVNGVFALLGVAPNAAKMKRLNQGFERRVGAQLRKTSQR